jgi:hypothetical protein
MLKNSFFLWHCLLQELMMSEERRTAIQASPTFFLSTCTMNRRLFLSAVLLLTTALVSAQVPGGFSAVDVNDERVQAAAKFAVAERVKAKDAVVLDKVVKAARQVVAGLNYDLELSVKVGDKIKTAQVRVWAKLDQTHELTKWEYVEGK